MVCADEVANDVGQVVLVGQLDAFRDVADNHLRTLHIGQSVVWVVARLVLSEIDGLHDFADVVIEGTRTDELALGPDLVGYLCCQVAHLYGVLEGAWRYLAHASQQVFVHVAELNEGDVRREAERLLNDIEQGV